MEKRFDFCVKCGESLEEKTVNGFPRLVCSSCGFVFYQNPLVQAVALAVKDGKVALITWGDKTRWALPAGFVERSESPETAVIRELLEETGLNCGSVELFEASKRKVNSNGMAFSAVSLFYLAFDISGEIFSREKHLKAFWMPIQKIDFGKFKYSDDVSILKKLVEK